MSQQAATEDFKLLLDFNKNMKIMLLKLQKNYLDNHLQTKELQDSLETEQLFAAMCKMQIQELKEEPSLKYRLETTDSESLANTEETDGALEKENTIKDLITKHKDEMNAKEEDLNKYKNMCSDYSKTNEILQKVVDDLCKKLKLLTSTQEIDDDLEQDKTLKDLITKNKNEIIQKEVDLCNKLKQPQDHHTNNNGNRQELDEKTQVLNNECLLKHQTVNKSKEVTKRTSVIYKKTRKSSCSDLRRREMQLKKSQQEFNQKKTDFANYEKNVKEQVEILTRQKEEALSAYEQSQRDLHNKDLQIEQLTKKLQDANTQIACLNSVNSVGDEINLVFEGWLSSPSKKKFRRLGWKRLYVVVSDRKISFFNSENDKQDNNALFVLDLCKVFQVRSVTQADVIRADSKEIPRIFQLLYAVEGESRKPNTPDVSCIEEVADKPTQALFHKGHEFATISYHMPTTCEVCSKPLWSMFGLTPALECKRCRMKIHRDHMEKHDLLPPCKLHFDHSYVKELLLLASNNEDHILWVTRLNRIIQQCGYKPNKS